MKTKTAMLAIALALSSFGYVSSAYAEENSARKVVASAAVAHDVHNADAMRAQGEQRFRANCSRCHAAPQKFPPRMMSTILRHMRVRATLTDEDMRLVLLYMTQ
jgi:mono/diheme cytochrome c family protein